MEKEIETIINRFNFETVQKYMSSVGWTYNNSKEIPTIEELKSNATELLTDVLEMEGNARLATGGFEARIDDWGDKKFLSLTFIIEDEDVEVPQ